jgi:hypothetical protein
VSYKDEGKHRIEDPALIVINFWIIYRKSIPYLYRTAMGYTDAKTVIHILIFMGMFSTLMFKLTADCHPATYRSI